MWASSGGASLVFRGTNTAPSVAHPNSTSTNAGLVVAEERDPVAASHAAVGERPRDPAGAVGELAVAHRLRLAMDQGDRVRSLRAANGQPRTQPTILHRLFAPLRAMRRNGTARGHDRGLRAALDRDGLVDGQLVAAGHLGHLGDRPPTSARASPTLTGETNRTLSSP